VALTFVTAASALDTPERDRYSSLMFRLSLFVAGLAACTAASFVPPAGGRQQGAHLTAPGRSTDPCDTGDPNDIMVRVGNFCVDKYEATVCNAAQLGAHLSASCISNTNANNGGSTRPAGSLLPSVIDPTGRILDQHYRAYSLRGIIPTRFVDYYQALAACANAGKVLVSEDVWQEAEAGTFDPGSNDGLLPGNTRCNTDSSAVPGIRATGLAGTTPGDSNSCVSSTGVEDLLGNLYEWTGAPAVAPSLAEIDMPAAYSAHVEIAPHMIGASEPNHPSTGFRCMRPIPTGNACETGDPNDVMVKVGAYCVDKYDAVVCDRRQRDASFDGACISISNGSNGDLMGKGGNDTPNDVLPSKIAHDGTIVDPNFRAYSKAGLFATRFVTYEQALSACANAGKELLSDIMWSTAALGTVDPGDNDGLTNHRCNTNSVGPRPNGSAGVLGSPDSCISQWGVEDLIGNLYQWTFLPAAAAQVAHLAPPQFPLRIASVPIAHDAQAGRWLVSFRCMKAAREGAPLK
jgi:formylglycine-generating enzyme required for sulfatase activity